MKNFQALSDRTAIGLSFLCAIHCLALPVLLVLLPSLASLQLDNEAFHVWMVFAVLPISIYALTLGCKKHGRYWFMVLGFAGLALLVSALLLEERVGEMGEKLLTLTGACLIAWGHFFNFRLCQQHENCDCAEH